MVHPVFFSVGGAKDRAFAEEVKSLLHDSLVYLYTRTGEVRAHIQREIDAELLGSRLLVVFWSEDYLRSDYAKQELATFRKVHESPTADRSVLIVPTVRKPPNIQHKWDNPLNGKKEFAFGQWRHERALDNAPDIFQVADAIRKWINEAEISSEVLIPRPRIQYELKGAVSASRHRSREFIFVHGFEGDGRRTAVTQFMDSSWPHLARKVVPFDNVDTPEDLLVRLLHQCGVVGSDANEVLEGVNNGSADAVKEIRRLIGSLRTAKSYLILAMDRYAGTDISVGVPKWVVDTVSGFTDGIAPLVFFVTSAFISDGVLKSCPNAGSARIPGLDENEISDLVFRLSSLDPDPTRWTDEKRRVVEQTSGSSPALCQIVMRRAAFEPSLEFLEELAKREEDRFAANMTAFLAFVVRRYRDSPVDLLALRVIEKLGVVSRTALEEILPRELGQCDVWGMTQLGLVERLADDLLRIPPLIQRRLGYQLLNEEIDSKVAELISSFGKSNGVLHDEQGPIYLANKAAAALSSGEAPVGHLERYVTISMLFKVGLDRYNKEDYHAAFSILSRAMDRLDSMRYIEDSAVIEINRYYGLAAARVGDNIAVERACEFLEAMSPNGRGRQAQAMSHFLKGFERRIKNDFEGALVHFKDADNSLKEIKRAERQHGAVLTEMSRALLRKKNPDFDGAVQAAERAYKLKDVTHNLSGLINARIERLTSQEYSYPSVHDAETAEIRALIAELARTSKRISREFHLVREAELEAVLAIRNAPDIDHIDFSNSINLLSEALRYRMQGSSQAFQWKLKVFGQDRSAWHDVIRETSHVLDLGPEYSLRRGDAQKSNILATARFEPERAHRMLLSAMDIGQFARQHIQRFIDRKLQHNEALATIIERI
ncbi:MAG: TIR domain-containing protein [Pseudomonadales bacterium]